MKIIAFEVRSDEMADFEIMNNSNNFEITYYKEYLCQKNLSLLNGYDGIAFLGILPLGKKAFGLGQKRKKL